ncbi:MAG: polysaccharide biosynthesis/export family protein [bacterium]
MLSVTSHFSIGKPQAGGTRLRNCLLNGMAAAFLVLPGAATADEYHLAQGDVLRVMIVGEPQLSVDVPIEMDGSAWFPLVGPIAASGETLRDIRSQTAEAYATVSFGRPVAAGTGLPQIIDTSQVYVTVASYRPIYVTGDVGTTHEIPYRTGLMLSQLLALASPVQVANGSTRQATTGEITAAATALAHEYAQIWRHKVFLGKDTPADFDRIFVTKGPEIDELVAVERSILAETRAGIEAQQQHIKDDTARIQANVAALTRQKDNEAKGLEMDETELATVQDLFSRNLVPASRLTDVRRASLVTASRLFQIDVALESAQGQVEKLKADFIALEGDARVAAWKDLGDAVTTAEQRRSDLERLLASAGGSQTTNLLPTETKAIVTRDGVILSSGETSPSLALMPGDIVEIRQRPAVSTQPSASGEANQ